MTISNCRFMWFIFYRKTFLVLTDYYSRFPFDETLKSTTSADVISKLFKIFLVHSLPETLTSDNERQLNLTK